MKYGIYLTTHRFNLKFFSRQLNDFGSYAFPDVTQVNYDKCIHFVFVVNIHLILGSA